MVPSVQCLYQVRRISARLSLLLLNEVGPLILGLYTERTMEDYPGRKSIYQVYRKSAQCSLRIRKPDGQAEQLEKYIGLLMEARHGQREKQPSITKSIKSNLLIR